MKKWLVKKAVYVVLYIVAILAARYSAIWLMPLVLETPMINLGYTMIPSDWVYGLLVINIFGIFVILNGLSVKAIEQKMK